MEKYEGSITPHAILSRMHEMEGHLSLLTIQILSTTHPGTLDNLFAGASHYAAIHSARIREAYERNPSREIDTIAWSTRCLMETRVLLHYILQKEHDAALKTVQDELTRDDCEIAFGFYHRIEDESNKAAIEKQIKTLPKTPNVFQLAETSGFTDEYRSYYKFLCKYTHPTMYLLFMKSADVRSKGVVDLMLEKAESYLAEVCEAMNYVRDGIE